MKNMLKLGIVLALYAAAACVLLALVNNMTAPVIAKQKAAEVTAGLSVVFKDADSFEPVENFAPDTETTIKIDALYLAKKDGKAAGAVIQATGPTYDKATLLIGVDLNAAITAVHFLSISDTPGFGQKAAEPAFYEQFAGKSASDNFEAGADMDMIAGATITTRGVGQILKYATYQACTYLAQNYGGVQLEGGAPVIAAPASVFTYEEAFSSLFPDSVYEEIAEGTGDIIINSIIERKVLVKAADGTVEGAMVAVRGPAYHEGGVTLTGVDMDGTIRGARIIELNDTPNIGSRALEESFYGQFAGRNAADPLLIPADVDALSGATITSACVADMVKIGAVEGVKLLAQHGSAAAVPADYAINGLSYE